MSLVWRFIVAIGVVLAIIVSVLAIYDRFLKNEQKTAVASKEFEQKITANSYVKEYIFGNKYFFLQVIADHNGGVLGYAVTTTQKDFNPVFRILDHAFQFEPDHPSEKKSLAFDIILGETHFSEFRQMPENIYGSMGARRFSYQEEYYFGNPGDYKTYFCGINDGGYFSQEETDLSILFPGKSEIDPKDPNVMSFRKNNAINTYAETAPNMGYNKILKGYLMGADADEVRVIAKGILETKETKTSLLRKLKNLSSGINIQIYFQQFGQALIINELPYSE